MTEVNNIHSNIVKLQVVYKKQPAANDLQFKDDARVNMDVALSPRVSQQLFLSEIINEYGHYISDFKVSVNDLSPEDRKLFLSHMVDAWDYEEYCSSPTLLQAALTDNTPSMQRLLDDASHDAYSQYLYSMGYKIENEFGFQR